mmetsp:Transcript_42153/g.86181  ORF Transcript_42153/g.86181 Transcript_42153/m.86181 type:complete len:261 (-) Transcript_42153:2-784(-)
MEQDDQGGLGQVGARGRGSGGALEAAGAFECGVRSRESHGLRQVDEEGQACHDVRDAQQDQGQGHRQVARPRQGGDGGGVVPAQEPDAVGPPRRHALRHRPQQDPLDRSGWIQGLRGEGVPHVAARGGGVRVGSAENSQINLEAQQGALRRARCVVQNELPKFSFKVQKNCNLRYSSERTLDWETFRNLDDTSKQIANAAEGRNRVLYKVETRENKAHATRKEEERCRTPTKRLQFVRRGRRTLANVLQRSKFCFKHCLN